MDLIIAVEDPNAADVRALLKRHLVFAARSLYRKAGFTPCAPFGPYTANPYSVCMTMALDPPRRA